MHQARQRPAVMPHLKLSHIAALIGLKPFVGPDVHISGLTLASSRVQPGDLFVASPGAANHGIRFLPQAIEAGARAVLTDSLGAESVPAEFPVLVIENPRSVLAQLATALYEEPSEAFLTFGITGTQGKTTSTHLAEAAFGFERSAVIGTNGARVAGVAIESALTTPESPELQALFAVMRDEEIDACFMEVSSHALVQGRVDGFVFDVAVFLNLGRDHLDFHKDIDDYFHAKSLLFTPEHARVGVVNIDDEFGRRLLEAATIPMTTFSIDGRAADWVASNVIEHSQGSECEFRSPSGETYRFDVKIPGRFNVSNALAVVAAISAAGVETNKLVSGLSAFRGVPGRMERIENDLGFDIVLDYAHKPEAMQAVLGALRAVTKNKLTIVFGAGGDRDSGKRPLMGQIAADLADLVVVTDDNPRSEDPAAIRDAIMAGAQGRAEVVCVAGRSQAIAYALERSSDGDTVVVAGKGHETGQEIAGAIYPFSDRDEILAHVGRLS